MEREIQARVEMTQVAFFATMTVQASDLEQELTPSRTQPVNTPAETPTPAATSSEHTATQPLPTLTAVSASLTPTILASLTPTSGPSPTLAPDAWTTMPVLPAQISPKMRQIYELGQAMGNDPNAFSKIGDCHTMLPGFLGDFDKHAYDLGPYIYLQPALDHFSGSFARQSRVVKDGLSASASMAILWNTWQDCEQLETPLDCEYRLHRPSFVIISLGTNDVDSVSTFETTLRRLIDLTIGNGIVPILATKADNAEGSHQINALITKVAYEYEIPLWNFWLSIQPLPQHGMRSLEHLSYSEYFSTTDFSKPEYLELGFNMRNLSALQVLDMVWRSVTSQPSSITPTPSMP